MLLTLVPDEHVSLITFCWCEKCYSGCRIVAVLLGQILSSMVWLSYGNTNEKCSCTETKLRFGFVLTIQFHTQTIVIVNYINKDWSLYLRSGYHSNIIVNEMRKQIQFCT